MTIRFDQARLVIPIALCAACGGDPVSYSSSVGINLKVRSADTVGGMVSDEKSVNTESGNPYGAFINDARVKIGRDPGIIEVESVELVLGGSSTGVVALGEVFAGEVQIVFHMNDTNNAFPVAAGTIDAAIAAGPVAFDVTFPAETIPDLDYVKLLNGSFKVIARGAAAPSFESMGAEADLQVTLMFAAFE
jgi:hypothetical protein